MSAWAKAPNSVQQSCACGSGGLVEIGDVNVAVEAFDHLDGLVARLNCLLAVESHDLSLAVRQEVDARQDGEDAHD